MRRELCQHDPVLHRRISVAEAVRTRTAKRTSLLALAFVLAGAVTAIPASWLTTAATFVSTWGFSEWVLTSGLTVLIIIGVLRAVTRHPDTRREVRPLRWWWGVLIAVAVLAATGLSLAWLLDIAEQPHQPQERSMTRIEAIRTALTLGAGLVGIAILVLNSRRQWLAEHTQRHTEADAAEQRVTELYTAAADQLSSERAPVRMAGVYALERLAQGNPQERQRIINVLCAYLRMPFEPPTSSGHPNIRIQHKDGTLEEWQVRAAIQRLVHEHLFRGPVIIDDRWILEGNADRWSEVEHVDLRGATLIDLDFHGIDVSRLSLSGAICVGETDLIVWRTYDRSTSMARNFSTG
ncbi:hypothetical protein [Saccharomonospora azurea]|uniref:hypothetical protein n=1 Tax=Saccharomonospora azurea TaxID=40988 RepID=UPI0012FB6122|nr:hypothetical protein [Saccharomonospora azurea]